MLVPTRVNAMVPDGDTRRETGPCAAFGGGAALRESGSVCCSPCLAVCATTTAVTIVATTRYVGHARLVVFIDVRRSGGNAYPDRTEQVTALLRVRVDQDSRFGKPAARASTDMKPMSLRAITRLVVI